MASAQDLSALDKDPRLFLYTSLTAGSSHIITATSRMETILKANKIPFQAIDTATDEKARRLWQRRAGGRKLPGLVKEGFVIGDLTEVEEWNEFGELKDNIGPVPANNAAPSGGQVGVSTAPPLSHNVTPTSAASKPGPVHDKAPQPVFDKSKAIALPGAAEIAARNQKKAAAPSSLEAINVETHASSPGDKEIAPAAVKVEEAKTEEAQPEAVKAEAEQAVPKTHPSLDHLSAPASRIQSGTATPAQTEEPAAPAAPVTSVTSAKRDQHRGSDIVEAPTEEIEKIESQNSLQEVEDEDVEDATKGVAELKVDEGVKEKSEGIAKEKDEEIAKEKDEEQTQDQKAKEPEAATKSVED